MASLCGQGVKLVTVMCWIAVRTLIFVVAFSNSPV